MRTIKAKPTEYRGVRMRSRLEAKWAAFFDEIGWDWMYEPVDLDGYIPDFLIKGSNDRPGLLVEVKPTMALPGLYPEAQKGPTSAGWRGDAIIAPEHWWSVSADDLSLGNGLTTGLDHYQWWGHGTEGTGEWGGEWGQAAWAMCGCGLTLVNDNGHYECTLCGTYYGGLFGHPGNLGYWYDPETKPRLEAAWAAATNAVRFVARSERDEEAERAEEIASLRQLIADASARLEGLS